VTDIHRQYTDEIHSELAYWAAWKPDVHVALGTCGPIVDRVFRPEGELSDFGITFSVTKAPQKSDEDYSSKGGVKFNFQTAAGSQTIPSIPQGNAGIHVKFEREEAVVLALRGAREDRIADQARLRREILAAAKRPDGIPRGWFVITHLVTCDAASVVVAQAEQAEFSVEAKADFAAGVVDLANAKLGLSERHVHEIGYKKLAIPNATPLFRGLRLKRGVFRRLKLRPMGPDTRSDEEIAADFETLDPATADA
jgi:hypothetical protein